MRYLILQTFLTLALLIYPLSLSAQNSFSLSVDLNSAAGDQAVTSLNTVPDQVVAIEIFGKDIQSANGLAVRFEYDASQVIYDGFDAGDVLPNAQALPEQGTGYVEIGIVSLGGQATANNGLVGTVRFRTTTAFSGTEIRLVGAELSRSGRFETIMPNIGIALQGAPTPTDFSLSLDTDSASGDQAVTSVNVSTEEVVAIQIFGKDIQNANGLAVRFEHDASQVVYEGFDVGDVLPNAQALPEQGAGYVEIGIASLGGQATANSGLVGTIRFSTTAAFTSTAIRLVRAELGRGGRFETIMPNIGIALQGASTPVNFSLSLDVDGSTGDQAVTSANVSADEIVAIQIFGTDIQNANGLSVRFEYDASQVVYEGFDVGDVLPNAQALPSQSTNPTYVEIGIVSLGGQATANNGLIGTVRLRTTAAFSGTEIRLVRAELGRGGQIESVTIDVRVALELQALTPDFNGDGVVNFADFLAFVGQFGTRQGDGRYEAKYDLDSDGTIGFGDFLIFSSSFDKGGSPPGGGSGGGSGGSTTDVAIPDANLRAVIANKLGKASGAPISRAEMATLTVLEAPNSNISDLTGLEFATGLTVLDLGHESVDGRWINSNEISDLSPLSGLNSLTQLNLDMNLISDVSALSGLTNLTRLFLTSNLISDVSPLSNLTNLTRLRLRDNLISDVALSGLTNLTWLGLDDNLILDVSALSGLTNLTWLTLRGNNISDVSPLSSLTNLTLLNLQINLILDVSPLSGMTNLTWLGLDDNLILDVAALSNLTTLKDLRLGQNNISDVSPLSNLTNLTRLYLDRNLITDVSPLSNLTNLTGQLTLWNNLILDVSPLSSLTNLPYLDLSNNSISDVSPLSNLTNLTYLSLSNNSISDVSPLSGMTNLTRLSLQTNVISDVSALSSLNNLTRLELWNNLISDVSALSSLTNLTYLSLSNNSISDVSPLSGMTNLTTLRLPNNTISDITPLSNLTNLTELWLHKNTISDVSALSNLTNLRTLLLYTNAITDLLPLVANMGLGSGDEVDVRDNLLSATSLNTHIPALQARGVDVRFGAGKPAVVDEQKPRMGNLLPEERGYNFLRR